MAMKLGEALVKESLITREQLKSALERQVIFGGRIGTNLIEAGIIKESALAAFLSKFHRLPAVKPEELMAADAETISCMSTENAEKYKAVPFRKDRNRLHVAMLDPRSMTAVDELRFIVGYEIIPYVTTELRLLYALEKFYGVQRDLRYISVFNKEEEADTKKDTEKDKEAVIKIKEQFASARDRDEIIGILLNETSKIASRVAVFLCKGDKFSGWKSKGITVGDAEISGTGTSIFPEVMNRKDYYRGPLLKVPGNEPLSSILGGNPQDCIMIPLYIREKLVAVLYADNGKASVLDARVNFINTLVTMASLSFELIIIRNKIFSL